MAVTATNDPRSLVAQLHKAAGSMSGERFEAELKDLFKRLHGEAFGRKGEFDVGAPAMTLVRKGGSTLQEICKAKGFRGEPDLVSDFRRMNDDVLLIRAIKGKEFDEQELKQHKLWKELQVVARELRKALDTSTAGSGAEWIPTGFSSQLYDRIKLKLRVAALHSRVVMPTDPFEIPTRGGDPVAYFVAEPTGDTPTKIPALTPSTGKKQFAGKDFAARILVSRHSTLDAIVAVLDLVRDDLVTAIANAEERALIDGDTAGTHQDSDVTSGTDARKAWLGYRKLAPAASKVDAGNVAATDVLVRSVVEKMGKYGVVPGDVAIVCGTKGYHQLLKTTNVLTVDKYGPSATILTGELGKLDGKPIIVSEWVRQDLNAAGVYDGVTTNRTIIAVVNRTPLLIGDRESVKVEADKDIETQQEIVVGFAREDFINRVASSEPAVGLLYNIA